MSQQLAVPTEYEEQLILIQYLELKGYPYFHVPNSTYTTSFNQKRRNKALGVKAGTPDLFIIAKGQLIAVELKRQRGGVTSPEQAIWILLLNEAHIPTKVCKGASNAIEFIESVVASQVQ